MRIKASFINPVDDEYDSFELESCKDIAYTNYNLLSANISLVIVYSTTYDNDKNKVIFTGKLVKEELESYSVDNSVVDISESSIDEVNLDNYNDISYEIEPQNFVDILSTVISNRVLLDSDKTIAKFKENIKDTFCKKLLDDNVLFYDKVYTAFGYVYNDEKEIGTFEKIKLLDGNIIELKELLLLPNTKINYEFNVKFKFNNKEFSYVLKNKINKDDFFVISKFSIAALDDDNSIYDVKPREHFNDYDDFMLNRRHLILKDKNDDIFNINFDDFDY